MKIYKRKCIYKTYVYATNVSLNILYSKVTFCNILLKGKENLFVLTFFSVMDYYKLISFPSVLFTKSLLINEYYYELENKHRISIITIY